MPLKPDKEQWRDTTYGEMYDQTLADLGALCDEFKFIALAVPYAGDLKLKDKYEHIEAKIDRLRNIRSDGGLPILRKSLRNG